MSGPAWRGATLAIANTATGPIANHALGMARSRRLGGISPRTTFSSRSIVIATTTASGTIASGTANTSGTNASWVGTVKPNGVSNSISVASASTSTHTVVWTTGISCGGLVAHSAATAAANAVVVAAIASVPAWTCPSGGAATEQRAASALQAWARSTSCAISARA